MAIGHIKDLGALVRMIRMARIKVLIRYLGFDSNTATGCIEVLAIVARALTNC